MIITFCEYEVRANAPFTFKLCIRTVKNNLVYQSNYLMDIHNMLNTLNIDISQAPCTTKVHRNYNGELTCTQTIYFIRSVD